MKIDLSKIKSVFKKPVAKNIPLTGGTVYSDQQKLKAAETITAIGLNETINTSLVNDESFNYEFWFVLNFHCEYFANYFKLECEDLNIYDAVIKAFKGYFYYGKSGILFIENKPIPVYEVKRTFINNGKVKNIELGFLTEIFSSEPNQLYEKPKNTILITGEFADKYYCELKGGISAYLKWIPFVKLQTQILKMVNNHRFFINKKIAAVMKDPGALNEELKAYFNPDNPFLIKIGNVGDVETNMYEEMGMNNVDNSVLSYYESITKIYYELLGRRKNTDFKKERNITAEVNASQENFDILLNNEKHYKELFLKRVSEISGVEIKIVEEQQQGDLNDIQRMNNQQQ